MVLKKKKSSRTLEADIASVLTDKSDLPVWNSRRGWVGGDSRTLYTFEDKVTGRFAVVPGGQHVNVGPNAKVRMATRAEAESHWQKPLSSGWKISP